MSSCSAHFPFPCSLPPCSSLARWLCSRSPCFGESEPAPSGLARPPRSSAAGWWKRDAERSVELVQINGGPGLLVRVDGEIDGVVAVRVENGYVTGAYHVRNPEKLSRVERETAVTR